MEKDVLSNEFNLQTIYPANSLQQGFIYHSLSQPDDHTYYGQNIFDYPCIINVAFYRQAWQLAIERYPILRTCFNWQDSLIQIINQQAYLEFVEYDVSQEANKAQALLALRLKERRYKFDLSHPQLFRLCLVKQHQQLYTLIVTIHHSILDGWSEPILLKQVHDYYEELICGYIPNVTSETTYFKAQAYITKHQNVAQQYWRPIVNQMEQANDLSIFFDNPIDLDHSNSISSTAELSIELVDADYQILENLVRNEGLTTSTLIQFAWHKLIQIYTGDPKTTVGTTVSGRTIPIEDIENSVGLYINTLPLMIRWDNTLSVREQLYFIHEKTVELTRYSFVYLAALQTASKRLFHSLLIIENHASSIESYVKTPSLVIAQHRSIQKVDYFLALIVSKSTDTLRLNLKYDPAYLNDGKASQLLRQLTTILQQIPQLLHESHGKINVLTPEEIQNIRVHFAATKRVFSQDKTTHQIFGSQVLRASHNSFSGNEKAYVAPKTAREIELCRIWADVLGVHQVGMQDDFFKLGGDSIVSIQVVSRMHRAGFHCRVNDIFAHRHIEGLLQILDAAPKTNTEQGILKGALNLSPIQSWFFEQNFSRRGHWNQSFLIRVPALSIVRLNEILPALVEYHDILRVRFIEDSMGKISQIYEDAMSIPAIYQLNKALFKEKELIDIFTSWQSEFDISNGYLWQLGYVNGYEDGSARLYVALHHLIVDAVSWRILIEDIKRLYEGEALGQKGSSYRQWTEAVSSYAHAHKKEKNYWMLQQIEQPDYEIYATLSKPNKHRVVLDRVLTEQLLFIANEAYHTEVNHLLLTALGEALCEWQPQVAHVITLEGHGRELIDEMLDVSRTVGWFTNMYPVRLSSERQFEKSISEIKERLRHVPFNGIGYGVLLDYKNLPKINFNYLGQFDSTTGYWQIVNKDSGLSVDVQNADMHLININGLVSEGVLQFNVVTRLSKEVSAYFSQGFETALKRVIGHCVARVLKGESRYTVSDFNTIQINELLLSCLQERYEIDALYPANSLQQGFIYHALTQPDDDAYRIQVLLDYSHALNVDAYILAWEYAIKRYPILRTCFNWEESLIQIVCKKGKLTVQYHDVRHDIDKALMVQRIQEEDRRKGFDLEHPTLLRLHVIRQDTAYYTVLKTEHHSISDGLSSPILLKCVHAYYKRLCSGERFEIEEDTTYLRTQAYIAKNQDVVNAYWAEAITHIEHVNDIRALFSQSIDLESFKRLKKPAKKEIVIEGNAYHSLKCLVQEIGITMTVILQFTWHKLIQIYTKNNQTIVGTTVSGRELPIAGIESSVGLHINTLPLLVDWSQDHSVREQLQLIHRALSMINQYSTVNLADLQKNGKRLFHSLLIFENYPFLEDESDVAVSLRASYEKIDYALALLAYEVDDSLHISLNYEGMCINDEQSERIVCQLVHIINQLDKNYERSHTAINLFMPGEYQQVLYDWNQTDYGYSDSRTIHQLFEEQVQKNPNHIALVFENQQLTYRQLNEASNQLAHYICRFYQNKLKPDTLIALCLDRSLDMFIGILGVLKVGAAYVPIEPDLPSERLCYLIDDTKSALLLTQSYFLSKLKQVAETIQYIVLDEKPYQKEKISNFPGYSQPRDLAYIIYTSGTTGKPKGVMIEHRSVVNYYQNVLSHFHDIKNIDFSTRLSFDLTITTTLIPLMCGKKIIIYTGHLQDIERYASHLNESSIEFIKSTPSYLIQLSFVKQPTRVKRCFVGGEKLDKQHIQQIAKYVDEIYDEYGPTETTVGVCNIKKADSFSLIGNIGKPYYNYKVYVLDDFLQPVPVGVIGELYVGGVGLARGYLNQPKSTKERFIFNPFATKEDMQKGYTKLYKTGDLVRWLSSGNLEYIGRDDFQVKINGIRLELSEIEANLVLHPSVKRSVVLYENGRLLAYYLTQEKITSQELEAFLRDKLPEYMLPVAYIELTSFPLTSNGKLDRRALLQFDFSLLIENYIAPVNEVEAILCKIWAHFLKVERVGVSDDFFRLGGHSILAMQVAHRMSKVLRRVVLVDDVFKCRTIKQLYQHIKDVDVLEAIEPTKQNQAPLSYAQERLWFIEQYEGGTDAYHTILHYELHHDVKLEKYGMALQYIVERHEVLRSRFSISEEGCYIQSVELLAFGMEVEIDPIEFIHRHFELTKIYPIRAGHYTRDHKRYLLIVFHHIAFDEWSARIFNRELKNFYVGKTSPALEIQYKDFAVWQRKQVISHLPELFSYWENQLLGAEPLNFPTDYPRPTKFDYRGSEVAFKLPIELQGLAQQYQVTLFTLLLSGFTLLLSRYTRQDDVLIGTQIANRQHPQLADLIGFFLNTLVLRIPVEHDEELSSYLSKTQEIVLEAQQHQDLPFEMLVEQLEVERDVSRHPLFQIMFVIRYEDEEECEETTGIVESPAMNMEYGIAKFDLTLSLVVGRQEIQGKFEYATSLFKPQTVERLVHHYQNILQEMLRLEDKPLKHYTSLSLDEYQTVVYKWNETNQFYPREKTLHQLFEEQVERTPYYIAVRYEDKQLTYQDLNQKANQLAYWIREQYVTSLKPDTLIAICVERSFEMLIGIWGILKAGGAYVPIDPHYPKERIEFILEDTQTQLVLTQCALQYLFSNSTALDDEALYKPFAKSNLGPVNGANDLAQVLYTSGTTGLPKGVAIQHSSIVNRLCWGKEVYQLQPSDVVLFKTPYVFDVSIWEIFWANWFGAQIVVAKPMEHLDLIYLIELIKNTQVTIVHFVPSVLVELTHALTSLEQLFPASIRCLFCSGETLLLQHVNACYKLSQHDLTIHNWYGPTEGAEVTTFTCSPNYSDVHIGKALQNLKVYILDKMSSPVPIGVIGELYIGGAGLARGYLNRPELTSKCFINNPFATQEDKVLGYNRLYKTGDLARWLADGNLEYIGRNDFQVKIRGYRVELGEIETLLMQHPAVKQTVVLYDDEHLLAYYLSQEKITSQELDTFLRKKLPEHMLPTVYIELVSLPLTVNGKLDRKALPPPEFLLSVESYIAPANELEVMLCQMWAQVLKVDRVGVSDDFFKLGGHSILAIQMAHRMSQIFRRDFSVATLFQQRTISRICSVMSFEDELVDIHPIPTNRAPLSFSQERLWFIEQYIEEVRPYHLPILYELDDVIIEGVLELALQNVVMRHEILRTYLTEDGDGIYYQEVQCKPLEIFYRETSVGHFNHILYDAIHTPFNLETEYPIRAFLCTLEDVKRRYLILTFHHIAFDGWSYDIFIKDLNYFYQREINNDIFPRPISSLSIQYKDFVVWQRERISGARLKELMVYWENKFKDYIPLFLATDYSRLPKIDFRGNEIDFKLKRSLSEELKLLAKTSNVTLHTILLSGFVLVLSKYANQTDITIGTVVANRQHPQLADLIGFFSNTLPLRFQLQMSNTLNCYIKSIQAEMLEAQLHQDMPFEKLIDSLQLERDLSKHPLFQVMFVMHQIFEGTNEGIQAHLKPLSLSDKYQVSTFDLTLSLQVSKENITGIIQYTTSLFEPKTIERLISSYECILTEMVTSLDKPISEFSVLSVQEYRRIIDDFNRTKQSYECEKTIHQLFEEQVVKTPEHVAIAYNTRRLTYNELNQKANQLAHYLRKNYSFREDELIALCLDRSEYLIIAMLGVLKAGVAYVPLAPSDPDSQICHILNDTNARLIISNVSYQDKWASDLLSSYIFKTQQTVENCSIINQHVSLIEIDSDEMQNVLNSQDIINPHQVITGRNLIYVIYTSGTTAMPKGVMIEHTSLVNFITYQLSLLNSNDIIASYFNYVFDAITLDIYPALLNGNTLHILSEDTRQSVSELYNYIVLNKITCVGIPPILLSELNASFKLPLRVLVTGGGIYRGSIPEVPYFINQYGLTETTVCSTSSMLKNENQGMIIGKPIYNTMVYVLDAYYHPLPIGCIGELYIGGAGLARGYLNQPELTAERFIPNPFASEEDKRLGYTRLYKTGDLVRWREDGNLEYIGRNDFQIKIRGYRVELGEIERAILSYEGIEQTVVLAETRGGEDNAQYLIAYFVSSKQISVTELGIHLKKLLSEYMIPQGFMQLDALPLTHNGKLDRSALPAYSFANDRKMYVAPKTHREIELCRIWADVLGVEQVGMRDDFFKLGGDSIVSIQVVARMHRAGFHCRVNDIFAQRHVEGLLQVLDITPKINIEQGILRGDISLSPIQTWFFEQNFPRRAHWNQSFLIRVPELSITRLNEILPVLVEHHDILRVRFMEDSMGQISQIYEEKISIPSVSQLDKRLFKEKELIDIFTSWQSHFDISNGPLWQLGYVRGYEDGSARLYVALHHLIVDTVSWRIFIEDIKRLYDGESLGQKGSSYRQWTEAMKAYSQKNMNENLYWQEQLLSQTTYPMLSNTVYTTVCKISKKETEQLLQLANDAYHTEINDLLLTALIYTLAECFSEVNHTILLESHGRWLIEDALDISRTMGWFTSMYPVKLSAKESLSESICYIKERLRHIPNKGLGFGSFGYENTLGIIFNYLGQFDTSSGYWQVVAESSGQSVPIENVRAAVLDIHGMVLNGAFHFSISSHCSAALAKNAASRYKKHLLLILKHCLSQELSWFTSSDFNMVALSQALLDKLQEQDKHIEAIMPANSLQQGFIYHALREPQDDAYRVQLLLEYEHVLDVAAYIKAWGFVLDTYPILRTYFNWDESLIQVTSKQGKLDIMQHDISSVVNKTAAIDEIQKQDRLIPFDLQRPTLLRLHLIKQKISHYIVLKSAHHSILDGWSGSILLNRVHAYYMQILDGKIPEISIDKAYLEAQYYIYQHKSISDHYWKEHLADVSGANDLSLLMSKQINIHETTVLKVSKVTQLEITGDIYEALKQLVVKTGVTLNVLLQFAWHKLIHSYTGDKFTIVGTTVSGRAISISEIEKSVGLYINTLPLIVDWSLETTVIDQLRHIEANIVAMNEHHCVDLASLQRDGQRLFHSLFLFDNYPIEEISEPSIIKRLGFNMRGAIEKSNYPLVLSLRETQNSLWIALKYEGLLITERRAAELLTQFENIVSQLTIKLEGFYSEITLLKAGDYQRIIYDWNDMACPYPSTKMIHQLFEEQVARTPDSVALIYEEQKLTYRELNERSNQLARFICSQYPNNELKPDTLIGLCLERSLEMVIGVLGILKAGGAYVPIDPHYPKERILFVLKDINSRVLLTQEAFREILKPLVKKHTYLIFLDMNPYYQECRHNLIKKREADDLAYVIYTSGTTGLPKGVMVEHRGAVNYVCAIISRFKLNENNRHLLFQEIVFGSTLTSLFGGLLSGARLYLLNAIYKFDATYISKYIADNQITFIKSTPSYIDSIALQQSIFSEYCRSYPVKVVIGGEKLSSSTALKLQRLSESTKLDVLIHFGATETIVGCTTCAISQENLWDYLGKNVIVGRVLNNYKAYVLDQQLAPLPPGAIGMLYIGGVGVARGYLNQPELTKTCFIANPFAEGRLYKTGDLVRYLSDGNIEYIGRNDFQVKIRGYRVELGEIESVLSRHNEIIQLTVQYISDHIVAYYVSKKQLDESELKAYLSTYLPHYMTPSAFIRVEKLPLTVNGKLDQKALPIPVFQNNEGNYEVPRNTVEEMIAKIWQVILKVERVGIMDDFFSLGGHSILAIQAAHRITQMVRRVVSVADIFKYRTIKGIYEVMHKGEVLLDIIPTNDSLLPLSYAQERIWFIEQYAKEAVAYHIPMVYELNQEIDFEALKKALQQVVKRHHVLRTHFVQDDHGRYYKKAQDQSISIS